MAWFLGEFKRRCYGHFGQGRKFIIDINGIVGRNPIAWPFPLRGGWELHFIHHLVKWFRCIVRHLMFVGISTGVTPFIIQDGAVVALAYTNRVTADGGYYEGVACLIAAVDYLDSIL